MSALGKGIAVIVATTHSDMSPITIPALTTLIFTHNLNKIAFEVIITDSAGNMVNAADDIVVTQPLSGVPAVFRTVNVTNVGARDDVTVYISIRWEENTTELDLIPQGDPRVVITAPI